MTVVLRADDVPAAARSEYVHEVVSAAFGPLDVRSGGGSEPPDQVRATDLGVVRVGESSASRPAGRPASMPATSPSSTSPAPPTGRTRGRPGSWPSPSRASFSRCAPTTPPS
jgi:hypothetical protein